MTTIIDGTYFEPIQWYHLPDEIPLSPTKNLLAISVNGEIDRTEYHDGAFWDRDGQQIDDEYYEYWTFGDFPPEYADE